MTKQLPFTFHFHALAKEMATHSSVLAWRIPGMGEPGGEPAIYGVAESRTRQKRLGSSSSHWLLPEHATTKTTHTFCFCHKKVTLQLLIPGTFTH